MIIIKILDYLKLKIGKRKFKYLYFDCVYSLLSYCARMQSKPDISGKRERQDFMTEEVLGPKLDGVYTIGKCWPLTICSQRWNYNIYATRVVLQTLV